MTSAGGADAVDNRPAWMRKVCKGPGAVVVVVVEPDTGLVLETTTGDRVMGPMVPRLARDPTSIVTSPAFIDSPDRT